MNEERDEGPAGEVRCTRCDRWEGHAPDCPVPTKEGLMDYLVDRLNRTADRVNRGDETDGSAVAEVMYEAASRIRILEDALHVTGRVAWASNHEAGERAKALAGPAAEERATSVPTYQPNG